MNIREHEKQFETVSYEVIRGRISEATVTDEHGTRADYQTVGQVKAFVNVVMRNGTKFVVWSGPSYEEALKHAKELASRKGMPVHDLIGAQPPS